MELVSCRFRRQRYRCPQARSVLQGHGVLLFRNRPLGLCCGAALRAWELHFGAGFLSVQKATLGSGACLLGAASVLQCHGAVLRAWVGSEGNVRQWSLLARRRFRPSVPWCVVVSQPPAKTSLWSCFEGMGAAFWSWFLCRF